MRYFRLAATMAVGALIAAGAPARADGLAGYYKAPFGHGQSTCSGTYGDHNSYDRRAGHGRRGWRCDFGTRPHRSALEDGFFGHGRAVRGGYDYDRGYPYDYYPAEAGRDDGSLAFAEADGPVARYSRCETVLARDGRGRKTVPVRICRN